jgi:type I restriction enzyme S subunit
MSSNLRSLNEIISFRGGGTPKKDIAEYWSDEIPWASVKDFKSLDLSHTQDSISRKGLEESSANLIPAGHVIIPTRMALGKAAINSIDLAINQDLRALIPKVPIDSRYLLHSMIGLAGEIERYGSGATVKGITQENLGKLQIPLPPLDEQKRIAAILDAADALRAKRRQSIAQLDALIQSTFLDLFGDPVTNPMGWEVKPLEELCSFLSGYAWKASAFNSDQKGNPVIRIQNVGTQSTDFIFTTENPIDRFWIKRGDLLLSLSGSFRLAAWNGPPALLNQRIVKLTPQKSLSVSCFQAALSRQLGAIESMGRHALVNNVALSDLKQVRLILPPLPLQQKFAAIVESVERQKAAQRAHLAELDTLFASLQHRAFRGEL